MIGKGSNIEFLHYIFFFFLMGSSDPQLNACLLHKTQQDNSDVLWPPCSVVDGQMTDVDCSEFH